MKAVVIGGGIAGCSTAFCLAQRGIAVTLIERHDAVALEASGNPLAMLYPKLSAKPSKQSALQLLAFEFTTQFLKNLPNNSHFFNACGQLQLALNAAELVKQHALLLNNPPSFCNFLNAEQASKLACMALQTSGIFLPHAGWVNPKLLCASLINHPLIALQANNHAASVHSNKNGWQVCFVDGALETDNVVICNANDVKQFGFCNSAKITPVRGQINFFAENTLSKPLKTIICSDHFISPAVDGWHSFGTSYAPNDMNTEVSAQDTANNLAALGKISPELVHKIDTKNVPGRVAWRSQTLDYMPLAGQLLDEKKLQANTPRYNAAPQSLPWLPGLYVNAGHGSKGMLTAPLCANLIASLITKTELPFDATFNPTIASRLNPNRFLLRELGLKQLAASLY